MRKALVLSLIATSCHRGGSHPTLPQAPVTPQFDGRWDAPQKINTDDSSDATAPEVAADPLGVGAVAAWEQSSLGMKSIWAARYDANSGLWQSPVLLEHDDSGTARKPKVTTDRLWNSLVVWVQRTDSNGDSQVNGFDAWKPFATVYHAQTNRWDNPTLLESEILPTCRAFRIGFDPAGNAFVVWEAADFSNKSSSVRAARFEPSFGWHPAQTIIPNDSVSSLSPQSLEFDESGNAHLLLLRNSNPNFSSCCGGSQAQMDLLHIRYFVNGSGWESNPRTLNDSSFCVRRDNPVPIRGRLVSDVWGNALAVWLQTPSEAPCGTPPNLMAGRFDAASSLWTSPERIGAAENGLIQAPVLFGNPSAGAVVLFFTMNLGENQATASYFDPVTGLWSESASTFLTSQQAKGAAQFAMNPDGRGMLLMRRVEGTSSLLMASPCDLRSRLWANPELISENELISAKDFHLSASMTGAFFAIWEQSDGVHRSVWARRYSFHQRD